MLIICESSSDLRLTLDNVRIYMGISNWLIIASTLYQNCLQYAGVSLTMLLNENVLSFATNLSIVPLKLFLTFPAVSVPGLILCIEKYIDELKWCYSYTDLAKNI